MKPFIRLTLALLTLFAKVTLLAYIWNLYLAGTGLVFAGQYNFTLPTLSWHMALAVVLISALFHTIDLKEINEADNDDKLYYNASATVMVWAIAFSANLGR